MKKQIVIPYFQFIIVNPSGSLHYNLNHQTYQTINIDSLIGLTSTFYAVDNLQSTIVPEKVSKDFPENDLNFLNQNHIQDIETSTFRLSVLQTITGYRFIIITDPMIDYKTNKKTLQDIYRIFTDLVLKDPFYSNDSQIKKNKQFTTEVLKILEKK